MQGSTRVLWPDAVVQEYFEVAEIHLARAEEADRHGARKPVVQWKLLEGYERDIRIACVFLATGCEGFLERLLWTQLSRLRTSPVVADALMDGVRGRRRLRDLYKRLVGCAAGTVLEQAGAGVWDQGWNEVAEWRNKLVHGGWEPDPEPKTLRAVLNGAWDALAALQNAMVHAAEG